MSRRNDFGHDDYTLTVNGMDYVVPAGQPAESLLFVLRERLGLMGSKNACEQGECGSCSVMVDDKLVCACLEMAAAAQGCSVTTVDRIGTNNPAPGVDVSEDAPLVSDVQQAMVEAGGVQCGFCTPGFVMAIHALLEENQRPDRHDVREALAGNLCRCTGYGRIVAAVEQVVIERAVKEVVG